APSRSVFEVGFHPNFNPSQISTLIKAGIIGKHYLVVFTLSGLLFGQFLSEHLSGIVLGQE
ncbi:MAG: hypothetical protein NTU76_00370, partial [Candidatus Taylorbacteria bacterium]|nr:hypothetical protein [Candidatus Taylorbacteria bacterium]